ncbi:NUDIX domain-containing protein [Rhizobium sp. S95]|uniref:NUDIX domain-containing protein n=1 Tax=Ciceribacter sichuanensis TaxID=2949647 RepID=A0AAJ1BWD9_9HYPH|nr:MULTISPECIES: NUDIX domain-containing protein [unclassified Ciceribacter]MCM2396446.1 NUDIX domain-containing protein [Ciceribacter sp. S95]MCO5957403.1 NUDIX domain-containing protein [Ciceribacter sp. S101]
MTRDAMPDGMPDAFKVLIYATWRDRLLVFDEPDFPEIALQVPGGTVEHPETVERAALREFAEETGLEPKAPFRLIETCDYRFEQKGSLITHRRSYFHVALSQEPAETWVHWETMPFGGGEPIRFRLFWLELDEARQRLGYGMADALAHLPGKPVTPVLHRENLFR